MTPKLVIGLIALYIMLQLINGVLIGDMLAPASLGGLGPTTGNSSYVSPIDKLIHPGWSEMARPWTYVGNLFNIIMFNYWQFEYSIDGQFNPWCIVKYVVLWPLSIGVIVITLYEIGKVLISVAGSVLGGLGRLLGGGGA